MPYSGNGIVLYGSTQLTTCARTVRLISVAQDASPFLAPEWTQQLRADSFIQRASGQISADVVLSLWLSRIDFDVTARVTLPANVTTGNTSIQDLAADLQQALNAATWTVVRSDNPNHPVDEPWQFDSTTPELNVVISESRLMLAGPWKHELRSDSVGADRLGWSQLTSGPNSPRCPGQCWPTSPARLFALASPPAPTENCTSPAKYWPIPPSNSEQRRTALRAPADAVYVELEATGLLETVSGSITLSPGARTVLYGSVIACGPQSDVVVTADQSIDLRGSLTAGRNLNTFAGTTVVPGTESIRTYGTSKLRSVHGGEIHIRGVNDVIINSTIGPGSGDLSLIELASTSGNLLVARESGRIETGTQLNFVGHSVEIAGVVASTRRHRLQMTTKSPSISAATLPSTETSPSPVPCWSKPPLLTSTNSG
ncbi:MAG UNVERIFIED_CONTAM: hypothetical protein LVR18_35250 [Planctomycetaceae bacterium]